MSRRLVAVQGLEVDFRQFASKLWGDQYFHPETRTFKKRAPPGGGDRSFVQFVMEPMYKIFSQVMGEEKAGVDAVIREFGVYLKHATFSMDAKPLLKEVLTRVFGTATGLVDMMVRHLPSARAATEAKVRGCYTGPLDNDLAHHMLSCDAKGPLVAHIAKLVPKSDCSGFDCLARIVSGRVKQGDRVRGPRLAPLQHWDP